MEEKLLTEDTFSLRLPLKRRSRMSQITSFSLNPSFIRLERVSAALDNWSPQEDPEKLISRMGLGKTLVYPSKSKVFPCVLDTGTYWRKSRQIKKIYSNDAAKVKSSWELPSEGRGKISFLALCHKIRELSLLNFLRIWQACRRVKVTLGVQRTVW